MKVFFHLGFCQGKVSLNFLVQEVTTGDNPLQKRAFQLQEDMTAITT